MRSSPLLLALLLPLGCVSYQFGPPPPPPGPGATALERCVDERRLTLNSASGTARLLNEIASTLVGFWVTVSPGIIGPWTLHLTP
jgi:hypothetical protein